MPVILSGPFLKRHKINQIHTRTGLTIGNQSFPLKAAGNLHDIFATEKEGVDVVVTRRTTIPSCLRWPVSIENSSCRPS